MDECSLAYHQTGIRGTVLRTQPLRSVRPEDRARLGDRRGNITYMASICNDPSFSNVLPQILLGNCQRFAKRVVEELKPSLPGNLFLWREKSAWNNRFQMRRYKKLLRQCLGDEVFQMREVFLVVDMASCHLHPSIPAVARSQGLRMVLVPAGLTSILQPLDTHVFRPFRGDRRGNITYMASICNDPSFSNVLPQILLGNCQRFAKRVVEELKPSLPGNLFLWREKSAWNNRFQMRRYIKLLRQCLGDEVFQMREVFLVVDMASCHLHPSIPAVARSQGLRMVLVPAGLTSILQPLDTHVFRPFRAKMQELWLACRSNHETGEVSLREWLRLVCKAIQAVVCEQDWEHAFERVGYLYGQALVSPKLLASLEWDSLPLVSPGLPGIGQAASMFRRKCQANVPMWVEWKDPEPYTRIQTLD